MTPVPFLIWFVQPPTSKWDPSLLKAGCLADDDRELPASPCSEVGEGLRYLIEWIATLNRDP